jgi:hypothetical protein
LQGDWEGDLIRGNQRFRDLFDAAFGTPETLIGEGLIPSPFNMVISLRGA